MLLALAVVGAAPSQVLISAAGLRQLEAGAVDFAASGCPIPDAKILVLHFPTVLGPAVPIYNLPGLDAELNFTPEALAGIFLGTIRKWDDPALPPDEIAVVHRPEASGATFVRLDFLSKASPAWISAASAVKDPPDDLRMSITGASGADAYPVASFTWLLTPARIADPQRKEIVAGVLRGMLVSGQRMAETSGSAPLPGRVAEKVLRAVARIN